MTCTASSPAKSHYTSSLVSFSVFNVSDVIGFETLLAEIYNYASVDVKSVPIIWYQHFAEFLGVDESLRPLGQDTLKGFKQLFWLDFSCEYPGEKNTSCLSKKNVVMYCCSLCSQSPCAKPFILAITVCLLTYFIISKIHLCCCVV